MPKYRLLSDEELPSIGVVLATLGKRNDYMRQTLESIKAQRIPNTKIFMVYPLDNQETRVIADEYNAKSIEDPGSMSSAVNVGIMTAWDDYDYVTWIGDDDLLLPGSLQHSLSALEANPRKAASYGYCQYIDADNKPLFLSRAGNIAKYIAKWGPDLIPLPGAVFRCSSLKKLDYIMDESLKYSMDLDLFLRLMQTKSLLSIPYPVSSFRWHESSITVSQRSLSLAEAEATKRRYLSKPMRKVAPIWELPMRLLTGIAQNAVNAKSNNT